MLTNSPDLYPSANIINMLFTPSLTLKHYHLLLSSVMILGLRVWDLSKAWLLISNLKADESGKTMNCQEHAKGLAAGFIKSLKSEFRVKFTTTTSSSVS